MSYEESNKIRCPHCGQLVPSGNSYCGVCGASVDSQPHSRGLEPIGSRLPPTPQYPRYDRKLSTLGRITGLLTSPQETMEDIGLAPDYGGVIAIFVIWTIISFIGLAISLPKIQFTGPYANIVNSTVAVTAVTAALIVPVVFIIRWLVKSYLIRHLCDSKSWDFETAASVTGYAYLPNAILSVIGIFVAWLIIPSIVIDTADLELALVQMELFNAQFFWIIVGLNTLISILALFWKSYLGSYGAYYGMHKNYERESAFTMFMVVGGIGFLIDFFSNFL